jgi:signal transduction histidine kinase
VLEPAAAAPDGPIVTGAGAWTTFGLGALTALAFVALLRLGQRKAAPTRPSWAELRAYFEGQRRLGIDRIVHGLAHELGTPLNIVSGHAMMIAAGEGDDQDRRESAEIIAEQSRRMAGAIRTLIARTTPAHGPRENRELMPLAERAAWLLRHEAERRGVVISVQAEPVGVSYILDAERFTHALACLVDNGIAAMPEGGKLSIDIAREPNASHPEGFSAGPCVVVSVRDTGTGMSEERIESLFAGWGGERPAHEPIPLGLAIARAVVRDYGGWIAVESRPAVDRAPAKGTVFKIFLPEGESACVAVS